MTALLVVAYLSVHHAPSIKTHPMASMQECRTKASAIYAQTRAGTVRAWCVRARR